MLLRRLAFALITARPLFAQCPDGTPPPCRQAAARVATSPTSIAVLPFESRSTDSADGYLAEGMTDEVANQLARTGRLQVRARTLVAAQWRRTPDVLETARRLNVAWMVHGNVRHAGPELVVNVELMRASSGEEAWAARFPRRATDVYAVQLEVAESVAVAAGGRLSPRTRATLARRPTLNNEAWRLYLVGNSVFAQRTSETARRALTAYAEAARLDPSFALAWAKIALVRAVQAGSAFETTPIDTLIAEGREAARRALALDSNSADAVLARGALTYVGGDFAASRPILERAIRLDSLNDEAWNHLGNMYHFLLDTGLAEPPLRRALALNPDRRVTWAHLYDLRFAYGQLSAAAAMLDTMLMLGPWTQAYVRQAELRFRLGDAPGALAALAERERLDNRRYDDVRARFQIAAGDTAPARALLQRLRVRADSGQPVQAQLAVLSMSLGLREDALAALALAATEGRWFAQWRRLHDPIFQPLHEDPRFQRLWDEAQPRVAWP